jgi:hypothetical protein
MVNFFGFFKRKSDNNVPKKTKIELERDKTYETRWVWYHTIIAIELLITNILLLWILWVL